MPNNSFRKILRRKKFQCRKKREKEEWVYLDKDLLRKDKSRRSEHQKVVMVSILTKTFFLGCREG
jgi:hypothetical protein